MEEEHPFTVEIETDPLNAVRFRWNVCRGPQIMMRSPHSYATRREASNDAADAMKRVEERHADR
jgi:hypothetical protein